MTDRYEALKEFIGKTERYFGSEGGFQAIKETMNELDNLRDKQVKQQQEEEKNLLTENDWKAMGYTERVKLKNNNPEAYQNAVAGKFKGAK